MEGIAMRKLRNLFPGTTITDWFLAAFFTGYLSIVAGIGLLYFAQKRREDINPMEQDY
jgi:hypothetical protein